jgi:hypothetical protein
MEFNEIARVALSTGLIGLAVYDLKTKRVPLPVTWTLMLAGAGLTVYRWWSGAISAQTVGLVLVTWLVLLVGYRFGIGAGDAQLTMGLVALFPDVRLLSWIAGVWLIGHLILASLDPNGWRRVVNLAATIYTTRQLPSHSEVFMAVKERGTPMTWMISLVGLLYLWTPGSPL